MKIINDEKVDYYCECCFAPVTPATINTTHVCDPKIKARREAERDAANQELNALEIVYDDIIAIEAVKIQNEFYVSKVDLKNCSICTAVLPSHTPFCSKYDLGIGYAMSRCEHRECTREKTHYCFQCEMMVCEPHYLAKIHDGHKGMVLGGRGLEKGEEEGVCDDPCAPSDSLITNSPMLFNDNYRLCKVHGCTDSECNCKRREGI